MKHRLLLYFTFASLPAFSQTKMGAGDSLAVKVVSFAFNKEDSSLSWTVDKAVTGKDTFFIRHFRWNQWKELDTIIGVPGKTTYSYKPYSHGGKNQYRLAFGKNEPLHTDFCCGEEVMQDNFCGKDLKLVKETKWEILDSDHKVLKQGTAKLVPISELPPGVYYFYYDNKMGQFIRQGKRKK